MKKIFLFFVAAATSFQIHAQSVQLDNETFTYNNNTVYHYGLGWYNDTDASAYGPMAYLSAFGGIKLFTGGWFKAVIDINGNLGIGTIAPQSLFQVDDGCSKANIGDASGLGLNYGTSYLGFNASRSGTNWLTNNDGNNQNGGGVMYSTIFGDLYFANVPSTGGSSGQTLGDAMVKSNINFRIDHDGTTYAKKIVIELAGWPDYVFKPTYKLRTLSEVKAYIDQNHRLPEVPSDKEVEAKGLDVSEMNKLLTKKVEELTLYLIQKDNELEQQRKISQLQEARLKIIEQH